MPSRRIGALAAAFCLALQTVSAPAADPNELTGLIQPTIGTQFVLPECLTAISMRPKDLMESKLLSEESLRPLLEGLKDELGLELSKVEHVLQAFGPRGEPGADLARPNPMVGLVVVRFSEPPKLEQLLKKSEYEQARQGDFTYYRPVELEKPAFGMFQPTLMLVALEDDLLRMIERKPIDTPLGRMLNKADRRHLFLALAAAEPILKTMGSEAPAFPPLQTAKSFLERLTGAEVLLTRNLDFQLHLNCKSQAAADQSLTLVKTGHALAMVGLDQQLASEKKRLPPAFRDNDFTLMVALSKLLPLAEPVVDGPSVRVEVGRDKLLEPMSTLLSAVAVQMDRTMGLGAEFETNFRLYDVVHGLNGYQEAKGRLPAAFSADKSGQPLLSWRVHLLPYLGEEDLYKKFKKNEPWDSPHNKKLLTEIPDCFQPGPSMKVEVGKTMVLGLRGAKTVLSGSQGRKPDEIIDGLRQTVFAVMAPPEMAVEWTKPVDLNWNPDQPTAGLFTAKRTRISAVMSDYTILVLPRTLSDESFRRLITLDDGKKVALPSTEFDQPFEPGDDE